MKITDDYFDLKDQVYWLCEYPDVKSIFEFVKQHRYLPSGMIDDLNVALKKINAENIKNGRGIIHIIEKGREIDV